MTIAEIMDRIAAELAPIGWPVMARPTPETSAQKYMEVALGDLAVTPATIDSPGLTATILVGLYVDMRLAGAYDAMLDGLEGALQRLSGLAFFADLEAAGVILDPDRITAEGPVPVSQGPSGAGAWRAIIRIPITRRRL